MTLRFLCEKLVRDKTIERYLQQGGSLESRILEKDVEFERELKKKLLEETNEVIVSKNRDELIAELADLQEVMRSLANLHSISTEEIESCRQEKFNSRGGFSKRIYSSIGNIPEHTPLAGYILASPHQYKILKPETFNRVLEIKTIAWKSLFGELKTELYKVTPEDIVSVVHIGSTSINGTPARPIVDMLVGVSNLLEFDIHLPRLIREGWHLRGEQGICNRRLLVKLDPHTQEEIARINCFEYTDPMLRKFNDVRTLLLANPALNAQLVELKQQLLANENTTAKSYQEAKQLFFEKLLRN